MGQRGGNGVSEKGLRRCQEGLIVVRRVNEGTIEVVNM